MGHPRERVGARSTEEPERKMDLDLGTTGPSILRNTDGQPTGYRNNSLQAGESFAYLVILPDPSHGNFIDAAGGVDVKGHPSVWGGTPLHYVKIGHQEKLASRVKSYNTHTPGSKHFHSLDIGH